MYFDATDRSRIRRKVGRGRRPDIPHRIGGIVESMPRPTCWGVAALVLGVLTATAGAQVFDSTSDGSDGALDFSCPSPPCEILFDPAALGLDLDDDNVFHFTTINVPAGVTVRMRALELNYAPVYWLATGAVAIEGTIDLSGEPGHASGVVGTLRSPSMPGPGGFPGGLSWIDNDSPNTAGFGPGAGPIPDFARGGNGAGYGSDGKGTGLSPPSLGNSYGNAFILPLVGGSGGSSQDAATGALRGGGGAGALLIASSESITVNGVIAARGGSATGDNGGGGSGGAIRMLAPVITGFGFLDTSGGTTGRSRNAGGGGRGRVRLEAFQFDFTGPISAGSIRRETLHPFTIFLPMDVPSVRVIDIDGDPVPGLPSDSFLSPDITISQNTVILTIEANNIPLGTMIKLIVLPEIGPDQVVETTPLAGTQALSTATASVTFEIGFSRFFVHALWTP